MFKKILVALDYGSTSRPVFHHAIGMAQSLHAELMLLHVLASTDEHAPRALMYPTLSHYPVLDSPFWEDYRQRWQTFESENLEWLKALTDEAIAQGISTEFSQVHGVPSRCICSLASTWKSDLILVGSRGRRGLSQLFLGSVSNDVMHHAPCSVLVVHDDPQVNAKGLNSTNDTSAEQALAKLVKPD